MTKGDFYITAASAVIAMAMVATPAHAGAGNGQDQSGQTATATSAAESQQDTTSAAQPANTETVSEDTAQTSKLADIVVTATRRSTNLQTTPLAVSAIDSSLIQQTSPRDVGDLAAYVPNFSAATVANFNAASFSIRGVGQNSIIVYFEPPVAVLVDDFVVPSVQTQLLDTFDVDQVEVLRGPQGTLFGKNTTGGAVVVKTKRPVLGEVSVEGRLQVGSFGTVIPQLAVNIPITDTIAFRGVGGHTQSDGYYHNGGCFGPVTPFTTDNPVANQFAGAQGCADGRALGGKDVWNGRAKLLFEPSSSFSALLQYEILRDRSDSLPSVSLTSDRPDLLFNSLGVAGNNVNSDPLDNAAVTNRQDGLIKMGLGQIVNVDGGYLNMDLNVGLGTFTSVTGYRSQRSRLPNTYPGVAPFDADGNYLSLFDANRSDNRKTFQQELRFASDLGGPFDFVAGGFYQHDKIDFCVAQLLGFQDLLGPGPTVDGNPIGTYNDNPYILCNAQKARSIAGYAEGTFKLTSTLTLTGGFRYSWEKKTWYGRQQVFEEALTGGYDPTIHLQDALDASVFSYPDGVIQVKDDEQEPTFRGSIGWQAMPQVYAYATYSRGFKTGAFNDQIGSFHAFTNPDGTDNQAAFAAAAVATKPERADSYEAGIKTQFLNDRLRFNLTGFYVDYSDLQKQIVVPLTVGNLTTQVTRFFNAASATVKGVEVEATAAPVDGLTLRGTLGYQDGKYNSYVTPIPAGYDLATAPLDRLPKWQWNVDGTYKLSLGNYDITMNGNVGYVARNLATQSITSPDENTFLNAHTLVNASITLSQFDNDYYIRLIGRNLTDERYTTAGQVVSPLWSNFNYGPPRYYGVELGFKFGQSRSERE